MSADVGVRDARPGDEPAWRELWAAYCDFYAVRVPEAVTAITWRRLVDPADAALWSLVAHDGGEVVGFANCVVHPRTWSDADVCYLEDLFVAPAARGRGAGRALLDAIVARARAAGWSRVYWHTAHDNRTARALYDSFAPADGFVRYVVDTSR